jgi:hypothetical protein
MVGADNGERIGDEIHLLRASANYGWPPEQSPTDAMPPVLTWSDTFAPAGLVAVPAGWGSWSDAATLLACGVVPGRMDLIDLDRPDREPVPVLDGCAFHLASGPPGRHPVLHTRRHMAAGPQLTCAPCPAGRRPVPQQRAPRRGGVAPDVSGTVIECARPADPRASGHVRPHG